MASDRRYHVTLSYSTFAASPEEALRTLLSAVRDRNGGYVEVEPDGARGPALAGDLPTVLAEAKAEGSK